jgi:hypothetical protein
MDLCHSIRIHFANSVNHRNNSDMTKVLGMLLVACLQHPYIKQILTPKDFYECAQENFHGMKYFYVLQVHIIETERELKECFSNCM